MDHKFRSNFFFQSIIRLLADEVANGVVLAMTLLIKHIDDSDRF
jgi:hypothetical protein